MRSIIHYKYSTASIIANYRNTIDMENIETVNNVHQKPKSSYPLS